MLDLLSSLEAQTSGPRVTRASLCSHVFLSGGVDHRQGFRALIEDHSDDLLMKHEKYTRAAPRSQERNALVNVTFSCHLFRQELP